MVASPPPTTLLANPRNTSMFKSASERCPLLPPLPFVEGPPSPNPKIGSSCTTGKESSFSMGKPSPVPTMLFLSSVIEREPSSSAVRRRGFWAPQNPSNGGTHFAVVAGVVLPSFNTGNVSPSLRGWGCL
ncbi:UNVERIFIED_CONTAM: hypothetical protein Sindi_2632200 [Sesamum indicum]